MAQKNKLILPAILAALAVIGTGIYFYVNRKKKPELPEPKPEPAPTPTPAPKPFTGVQPATFDQIKELQTLINKRFQQLNKENEFPASEIDGGYKAFAEGGKTAKALQSLLPESFATLKDVNALNVNLYIGALKKIVEQGGAEIKKQTTSQTTRDKNAALSQKYVNHFNAGGALKLSGNIDFAKHQYDKATTRFKFLDQRDTVKAGTTLKKGGKFVSAEVRLSNGQIIFYDSKGVAYISDPINLIAV